jgi:hypothetical protein
MADRKELMNRYIDLDIERGAIERQIDKGYQAAGDLLSARDIIGNDQAVDDAINIIEDNIVYHTVNRNDVHRELSNLADLIGQGDKDDE